MDEQLRLVLVTDVLVGMHGAGLTHALFLPPHAGLIEFFPSRRAHQNEHFRRIALNHKLKYLRWTLDGRHLEGAPFVQAGFETVSIPPAVMLSLLQEMLDAMSCPQRGTYGNKSFTNSGNIIMASGHSEFSRFFSIMLLILPFVFIWHC